MRARTIDLTAANRLVLHREERAVRAVARRPWFYLLGAWSLGRTLDYLIERQARRELRSRVYRTVF